MPEATEIMVELTSDVQTLAGVTRQATDEMTASDERGLGSKGRLSVAIRYAGSLEPLAEKTEDLVERFSERIGRVEGGVVWMFDRIEKGSLSPEETEAAQDLLQAMVKAGNAASESITSTNRMIESMDAASGAARPLRTVTRRLMTAYRQLVLMMGRFERWGSRAAKITSNTAGAHEASEEE